MIRHLVLVGCLLVLAGAAHAADVKLRWTAPGDDGVLGRAFEYDLRYSTSLITPGSFASAPRWTAMPAPSPSGALDSVTVTGLAGATQFWFALKTADEVYNWSPISNVITKTTAADPDPNPPAAITDLRVVDPDFSP